MKKIPKGPAAALPNPELKAIAKARANTVKEMAARDEPVSDDHAEGEQEEPKEEEATAADDDRQGSGTEWSKVSRCQKIFSSLVTGPKNSPPPRLFKSQFINKICQHNTKGEYVFAPGNAQLQVFKKNSEIRTSKSQVTGLSCSNMLWEKSREASKLWMIQKGGDVYQDNSHSHWEEARQLHGLAWWPSQPHQGWESQVSQFMPSRASVGHDIKEAKGVQERLGRDCQRLASKSLTRKARKQWYFERMPSLSFQRQNACLDNVSLPIFFILAIILFHSFCDLYSLLPCSCVKKKSVTQALLIIRPFDPIQVPRKKTCDLAKLNPVSPCICQRHTYLTTRKHQRKNIKQKINKFNKCENVLKKNNFEKIPLKITLKNCLQR